MESANGARNTPLKREIPEQKRQNLKQSFTIFLILLLLVNFFWFLGTTVSDMLLDELVLDFGGEYESTKNKIQFYDSFFQYATAFSVIFFGILVDKFPERRKSLLILVNIAWISVNVIAFSIDISDALYVLMQIIWGLTMGANGPIVFSYLCDLFEVNFRGRLFSIFAIVLYFIKGSSNVLTGIIGGDVDSWKLPLLVMAVGGSVALILFGLFAKEP